MSLHRRIPRLRFSGASSARLEHERLSAGIAAAVAKSRTAGFASHALLVIEIDGFERVRDRSGVHAVERILVEAENRARGCVRAMDEMAMVAPAGLQVLVACDGDAARAWQAAELFLNVLTAPYALEDGQVALTALVGVALVQPHHRMTADVTHEAFAALQRARSVGVARCAAFDTVQEASAIAHFRLAAELRRAVDRAEFRMHYQPILDCRTGALVGLEALLRWEHPTKGCQTPTEFLPTLVRAGLMEEVGRWTVAEVARQAVEWRNEIGLRASIAVNVSPTQLAEPAFVPQVLAIVAEQGASPASIAFELTEDIEIAQGETPLRVLSALRSAGFRVHIDDFGTGFSSLSYLQRLSIDGLKIDRAFIRDLEHEVKQRQIVGAIIRLAHVLNLDVVAEGVERREQMEALRLIGCDHVQGHFFSPPLPASRMRAWLGGAG